MGTIIFRRFPFWIISLINYTVFMEKRLYGKPLMRVDTFTPSEYVSVCQYVKSGDCYTNLYHDTNITNFIIYQDSYGYYDNGENVYGNNLFASHSSHGNLTPSDAEYFKTDDYPNNINDDRYYTGVDFRTLRLAYEYTNHVSGNIYQIEVNGTTHYFREYTQYGNFS